MKFDANNISVLQIELSNQCNAACPACAREIDVFNFNSKINKSELTLDQFKEYFSKSYLRSIKQISFSGMFGDPIMAKDVYDIVKYIKQSNPLLSISINTNGSLRNTKWWAKLGKLMQYSKDIVVWGIDGLEDTHAVYRVNTSWNKIIDNAKAFINAGGNAHWAMLVFDYNEHQLKDCEQLAEKLGFKEFISKHSMKHRDKIYNIAFPRQPKSYKFKTDQEAPINCSALQDKSIYISADGTILPCCYFGDRLYLKTFSDTHPDILSKDQLNIKNLSGASESFNKITETWNTNNPVDVCKKNCKYNSNTDTSDYRIIEQQINNHVIFNSQ